MKDVAKRVNCILVILGICLAVGVSIKMIFCGFSADEEYQLVLSYRLATGDKLFRETWDTIQTSGFLGAALLGLFLKITGGTTGSLLFLRICGEIIQAFVAGILFKTLRKHLSFFSSFAISVIFFVTYIKMIAMPDFSNLHTWASVLLLCSLWRAYDAFTDSEKKTEIAWLMLAAVCTCVAVLATAGVAVFPIVCVLLCLWGRDGRRSRLLIYAGMCVTIGLLYIGYILLSISPAQLIGNMGNILAGDDTHMNGVNLLGQSKWFAYGQNLLIYMAYMVGTLGVAFAVSYGIEHFRHRKNRETFVQNTLLYAVILAAFISLFQWLVMGQGYDSLKLYIPLLAVIGIVLKFTYKKGREALIPFTGILIGLTDLIHVLLISNVTLFNNIAFLFPGALCGLIIWCMWIEKKTGSIYTAGMPVLLGILVLTSSIGTGYTFMSSGNNNLFSISGIVKSGPAKGLLTTKDIAYVYYNDYNTFSAVVEENATVLIVTDFWRNTSVTSCYMENGVNISHYSVNSTPTYSDKLLDYWELYPEKRPSVIMVNTTVVSLSESDWIYRYIHDDFGYTEMIKTDIAEYYFK